MAKIRSEIRNIGEYVLAKCLSGVLGLLPMPLGRAFCHAVGDIWRLVDRRHRERAVRNCMEALSVDEKEAQRIVAENYRHYALLIFEMSKLRRMGFEKAQENIDPGNIREKILAGLSEGKGLLLLTGHIGHWEWGSIVKAIHSPHTKGFIARSQDNPYLDREICRIREWGGGEVWEKRGAILKSLRALKENRAVVAVVDQRGQVTDPLVPFLGKDAKTMAAPIDVAIRTGSPLLVAALLRSGSPCHFTVKSGELIHPDPEADPAVERLRILTQVNCELGDIIRSHPEQWIWIHDRWR